MNLDELRSVQSKERRKDSLQHLRDAFYDDVAAYINDLRAARDRRAGEVDNPFSDDDVRRMSDEIETAEEVAEALYERRVGKVVKLASFAAAEMSVETEGMTTQERDLFDDLVARISENKSTVLDVLAGETGRSMNAVDVDPAGEPTTDVGTEASPTPDPTETADPTATEEPVDGGTTAEDPARGMATGERVEEATEATEAGEAGGALADAMARESTAEDSSDSAPDEESDDGPTPVSPEPAPPGAPGVSDDREPTANGPSAVDAGDGSDANAADADAADRGVGGDDDRTTVRVTRDVGEILGVDDREYELENEDVVTLPAANADPLLQRDAAERLD